MTQFDQGKYMEDLKKRGAQRNVTQEFQLTGLEIATLLCEAAWQRSNAGSGKRRRQSQRY
jgi:hypothetical protein